MFVFSCLPLVHTLFRIGGRAYAGKTERTGSKNTQTAVGYHGTCVGRAGTLSAGSFAGAGCPEHAKHCFPLDTTAWRVSDAYGARTDPFTGKSAFHRGLDLACAAGTAVQAVQGGVVTAAAYSPSYGNHLRILHPDGCETRYAHLQYLYVRPGEVVQAGQTLGTVGQTGRATGAHLHLELWQQGAACDPAALLETAP